MQSRQQHLYLPEFAIRVAVLALAVLPDYCRASSVPIRFELDPARSELSLTYGLSVLGGVITGSSPPTLLAGFNGFLDTQLDLPNSSIQFEFDGSHRFAPPTLPNIFPGPGGSSTPAPGNVGINLNMAGFLQYSTAFRDLGFHFTGAAALDPLGATGTRRFSIPLSTTSLQMDRGSQDVRSVGFVNQAFSIDLASAPPTLVNNQPLNALLTGTTSGRTTHWELQVPVSATAMQTQSLINGTTTATFAGQIVATADVTLPTPRTGFFGVGVDWERRANQSVGLAGGKDLNLVHQALAASVPSLDSALTRTVNLSASVADGSNLSTVRSQFDSLVGALNPHDTLVVYFATHGGQDVTGGVLGDEPPVEDVNTPSPRTGHEFLGLSEASDFAIGTDSLSDVELASLLSDPRLDAVNKVVLLDACESGGFGSSLVGIPNVALLAAAPEGGVTHFASSPYPELDGTGFFSFTLANALVVEDGFARADHLGFGNMDGIVSVDELSNFMHAYNFGDLIGQEFPFHSRTEGVGEFLGVNSEAFASSDFTGGIRTVPETQSINLAGVGAVLVTIGVILRRRGTRSAVHLRT